MSMNKQPTGRGGVWAKVTAGSLAVVIVGALAVLNDAFDLCDRIGWCTAGAPVSADDGRVASANQISTPDDGARIPHDVEAGGSAAPPTDGTELWLFVEVKAAGRFYPGPGSLVVDAKGRWTQDLHVGGAGDAAGDRYALHLVLLGPAAAADVAAYQERETTTGKVVGMTAAEFTALHPSSLDDHSATRQ